jgi:anti-sigma-K factor RskA
MRLIREELAEDRIAERRWTDVDESHAVLPATEHFERETDRADLIAALCNVLTAVAVRSAPVITQADLESLIPSALRRPSPRQIHRKTGTGTFGTAQSGWQRMLAFTFLFSPAIVLIRVYQSDPTSRPLIGALALCTAFFVAPIATAVKRYHRSLNGLTDRQQRALVSRGTAVYARIESMGTVDSEAPPGSSRSTTFLLRYAFGLPDGRCIRGVYESRNHPVSMGGFVSVQSVHVATPADAFSDLDINDVLLVLYDPLNPEHSAPYRALAYAADT